ncbi:MAG TPA: hypothetical protein VML55_18600 [Planctomycetaceae bacterium]|nr:hypothetical protein [Planctomycetaceae bacterium]
MNVVVLSNALADDASAEERDVLVQVQAVSGALRRLGRGTAHWVCTLNLAELAARLRLERPDVVFNLVEALDGTDRLAPAVTLLLDALEIPYTGSPTMALLATASKTAAKQRLREAGLPTPAWSVATPRGRSPATDEAPPADGEAVWPRRIILKPVWEHASLGMDDSAVVTVAGADELLGRLHDWTRRLGRPCFAEDYIDGREFNVALLAGRDGPDVLPPAEIDFSAFPAGKPRIVGYRAKWEAESFEYGQTPRRFDFPGSDASLLDRLRDLALRCWAVFGLGGYARVDFRVDAQGRPWILEINTNPCLSPDAGFAAALEQSGLTCEDAVARIVDGACIAPR